MNKEIEAVKKIQAGYKPSLSFSKPIDGAKLRVLSLGAGVQSSVLALMAARGEIGPRIHCAIFADTQWEPKEVYTHLDWLEGIVSNPLRVDFPFPIYRVTAGNIYENSLNFTNVHGNKNLPLPVFNKDIKGRHGMGGRHCTSIYKIDPIKREIRRLLGVGRGQKVTKGIKVEQWLGISTDEKQRLKKAKEGWLHNRWPLIENSMSRQDCFSWWDKNYPDRNLAKSACVGCPYRTNDQWRDIKNNDPNSFAQAVHLDETIRKNALTPDLELFLHSSRKPLEEVDFSNAADKGQVEFGFLEECEGMCGV